MLKKVTILSSTYPYPIDNGKKIVISGLINYFLEREFEVEYLYLGIEANVDKEVKYNDNLSFLFLKPPSSLRKLSNIIFNTITRSKSIQESVLYSTKIEKEIHTHLNNIKKNQLVLVDTIRMAQYINNIKNENLDFHFYLDDLYSIRYKRMLSTLEKYPNTDLNPLGNFASNLPSLSVKLLNNKFIQNRILTLESKLVKKSEIRDIKKFENNYLINFEETESINKMLGTNKVKTINPILPISKKSSKHVQERRMRGEKFVFLGSLNISHNKISIENFIEMCMSKLILEIPNIELIIIGKNPSDKLLYLEEKYKGHIKILGFVADLDNLFDECVGMIIPLLFGTGVKLKTLDAFARGLPVISTSYGVEGINLDESICIVNNDISQFPKEMKKLTDKKTNCELSLGSKQFFENKYNSQKVSSDYDKFFNESK